MSPRLLVLSNCGFSNSDSNGRTLAGFLEGWPKQCLAQFFLHGTDLNFEVCDNYYMVSDKQALKSIFGKKFNGKVDYRSSNNTTNNNGKERNINRNPLTMLIRNGIWNIGLWKRFGYDKWVKEFNPEVVLLQAGDSPFMYSLAVDIAHHYNSELYIYNSEGYYFKNYDYFKSHGIVHLFYPLFLKKLKQNLEAAYNNAKFVFYSCESLKRDYDKIFKIPSKVFYTASAMSPINKDDNHGEFIVSYCGNLGNNRHKSLIQVANVLQEVSNDLHIDVYGRIPNELVGTELNACKGINYKEFVSYDEVKKIMYNSDLLLHVESFDEFYIEDLKYAFSTKIADSVSCGIPLLLYAPESLACAQYFIKNGAAHVVSKETELYSVLKKIVKDGNFRNSCLKNAIIISEENHNQSSNIQNFQKILMRLQ